MMLPHGLGDQPPDFVISLPQGEVVNYLDIPFGTGAGLICDASADRARSLTAGQCVDHLGLPVQGYPYGATESVDDILSKLPIGGGGGGTGTGTGSGTGSGSGSGTGSGSGNPPPEEKTSICGKPIVTGVSNCVLLAAAFGIVVLLASTR